MRESKKVALTKLDFAVPLNKKACHFFIEAALKREDIKKGVY